jgi:hypothetical protein
MSTYYDELNARHTRFTPMVKEACAEVDALRAKLADLTQQRDQASKNVAFLTDKLAACERERDEARRFDTGTPTVAEGKLARFWCIVKPIGAPNLSTRYLCYGNKYVMPLSDDCYDPPENAVPVGDDGEYEWTGWFEPSCDQCETQWAFSGEVIAWKALPRITEARANLSDAARVAQP